MPWGAGVWGQGSACSGLGSHVQKALSAPDVLWQCGWPRGPGQIPRLHLAGALWAWSQTAGQMAYRSHSVKARVAWRQGAWWFMWSVACVLCPWGACGLKSCLAYMGIAKAALEMPTWAPSRQWLLTFILNLKIVPL